MLAKFVWNNLEAKYSAVNLFNSAIIIYLLWSGILFTKAIRAVVVAKLVILAILFLTSFILALKAAVVAKLVILRISLLTSFILPLRVVLIAKLVISGILSSIFLSLQLHTFFLTKSFLLHHLVYLNQQEQVLIY